MEKFSMTKKILIIADPLDKLSIYADSTYLLFLTAKDLGMSINFCNPNQIYALNNHAYALIHQVTINHGLDDIHSTANWFSLSEAKSTLLDEFDAILVRNDPPFTLEYYYLTQLLGLVANNVKIFNPAHSLRNFNEKLAILNFPQLITPTLVSKNKSIMLEFIQQHGLCVAKPIDMMAGRGVFQISADNPNQNPILETLTDYFSQTIMLQKFIPEVVAGDKRIFIINGEVVDYCLYRIPQPGQIRGNLAVGGRGEVNKLNDQDYHIARTVAKWTKQQGILIAGIDVIGNYLTEINITSPTAMQHIYQVSGINIAKLILELI
ncbi:MAG: glutathione synthase [Pseudomonadota bacterium]|jgi:glutathione synthase